jgi:hypothetical protein
MCTEDWQQISTFKCATALNKKNKKDSENCPYANYVNI